MYTTRFVITHKARNGMRQLTFAQQGRHTYATKELAEEALEAYVGPEGLSKVLNEEELKTLEVRPCNCYANSGDPVGIWFTEEA